MSLEESDVARARRFEVLDEAGQVRVVLGRFNGAGPGQGYYGVELYDASGSARAWLFDEHDGTQLCLTTGGNQVLAIETGDVATETDAGPSITLCDPSGAPVLWCRVDERGRVRLHCEPAS